MWLSSYSRSSPLMRLFNAPAGYPVGWGTSGCSDHAWFLGDVASINQTQHQQHRVELVVAEGQVLRIRVAKLRVEAFRNSAFARLLEQRRHVVHPHRRRARPRGGKGRVAV